MLEVFQWLAAHAWAMVFGAIILGAVFTAWVLGRYDDEACPRCHVINWHDATERGPDGVNAIRRACRSCGLVQRWFVRLSDEQANHPDAPEWRGGMWEEWVSEPNPYRGPKKC